MIDTLVIKDEWFTLKTNRGPAYLDLSQSHVSDVCISYVIVRDMIFF